ncbi:MAG: ATP-binding protein [Desulfovibrio sp.]|nr:ATP-binding protein [Desulfovibrio sp.]
MRELVVISGKGGTGKTSLVAAFAALAQNTVFCDLDVDVPDLHIILRPKPRISSPFMGGNKARVRSADCIRCGQCKDVCRFDAVRDKGTGYEVDEALCEGCGVCVALCPEKAMDFPEARCGEWHISQTRFGPMLHAALAPGQENSGRLVSLLKKEARDLAKKEGYTTILCDGSPGIGCPVISSLAGATVAVIVTEPSLSGRHDLERVAGVCRHFRLPFGLVINRWDLNPEGSAALEAFCRDSGITVFGRIPFDADMLRATAQSLAATELHTQLRDTIVQLWQNICHFRPATSVTLRPYIPAAPLLPDIITSSL